MTVKPSPPPRSIYQKIPKDIVFWLLGIANRRASAQDNSVATTVDDLRTDFNLHLAKMREAGLMEE